MRNAQELAVRHPAETAMLSEFLRHWLPRQGLVEVRDLTVYSADISNVVT